MIMKATPLYSPGKDNKQKQSERASPPNPYPSSRQVLGRFAPGIRRADGTGQVIGDVNMVAILSRDKELPQATF